MRTISWICVFGMGIGVFSLILVISVMNGFNDSMKSRLVSVEPHLVVRIDGEHPPDYWTQLLSRLEQRVGTIAYVYEASDAIVRTVDGYVGGAVVRGLSREALNSLLKATVFKKTDTSETELPASRYELKPGEVIMGVDLAVSLGVFEESEIVVIAPEALLLPKGEVPPFERLKVRAIVTTNVPDIDAKTIFYLRDQSLTRFRNSASHERGLEVRFDDWTQAIGLQAELKRDHVESETWADRNSALFFALKLEKFAIGAFLSLSALIASFSIVAVLMLLMTQKRRDLGLLMALGMSPRRTRGMFAQLGMILSFAGIGGGMILGLSLSLFIQKYPLNILPEIYHDRSIPASVSYPFVVCVLGVASVIAFVSSWIPAKRNTAMSPSEALRGQLAGSDD